MSAKYVHTCIHVRDELPLIAFVADPDGYRIEPIEGDFSTPQDPAG
jgi:lactoylglutathione lyase